MSTPYPLWMQPPNLTPAARHVAKQELGQEHLTWPWSLPIKDSVLFELEHVLTQNPGKGCQLVKYEYKRDIQAWRFQKATSTLEDIKNMVLCDPPSSRDYEGSSTFIVASSLQDEAVRALGHWMGIPPTFFMLPDVRLRVVSRSGVFLFTLQYFSKYDVDSAPSQAQRSNHAQGCRFKTSDGHNPHEWRFTQARLVFLTARKPVKIERSWNNGQGNIRRESTEYKHIFDCRGLYMFDQEDSEMALKLKDLLLAFDRPSPIEEEIYQGVGQILQDVIYLVACNWLEFLNEADVHLNLMSKQCVAENLSPDRQIQYMQELHELLPLWTRVRRHLTAISSLIAQVLQHGISDTSRKSRTEQYYVKSLQVVDDQLGRCSDLVTQTNNLISLIFNLATLQESRAAVEESKAANRFASSIQRVTILTFVYLPLTLASSILGMNVTQITGEVTHSQLWIYFVIAVVLMGTTFGGWFVWAQLQSRLDRRSWKRSCINVAKEKGV